MKTLFKLVLMVIIAAALAVPGFSADKSCSQPCKKAAVHEHGKDAKCCVMTDLKLTDNQKAEFDKFHKECSETTAKIHEKIAKLNAEKCKLMTAEKPDKKAIDSAIEEIGKLTVEGQKLMADCKLKIKALLTPEQMKKLEDIKEKEGCCQHGHMHCCKHTDAAHCTKKETKEGEKEVKKVTVVKSVRECPAECLGHNETNCPAVKKK